MKIKLQKSLLISGLSLSILFNSQIINANIDKEGSRTLTRYNSQELVSLRGEDIKIPIDYKHKEDQFRGVWVSTVFNIDFPKNKNLSSKEYKSEYIKLLDNLEALNMNTVIFQVRPKSDAFYKSKLNPWSEYLTGKQGKSPNWDPLSWMIEETHKRGMEFHAWFNPYRVNTGNESLESLSNENWAKKNPSKVFSVDNKIYLNPGEPDVIKHINDTVMEVVKNYDIDAVHFDDYFYPSKRGKDVNTFFAPSEKITFDKYGKGSKDLASWRRDNIDQMVLTVSDSIKSYNSSNKKDIKFGISPFGIWGHESNHPANSLEGQGSKTPVSSTASYDNQFADTRKWVKNEWIDYIAPQVYWAFDTKAAPYGEITHWWAETVKNTNVDLYIGHASYKKADKNNSDQSWKNSQEILNQLKFNSNYEEIDGSIFFSYKSMLEGQNNAPSHNEFLKILKNDYFKNKTKLPKDSVIATNTDEEGLFLLRPKIVKAIESIRR